MHFLLDLTSILWSGFSGGLLWACLLLLVVVYALCGTRTRLTAGFYRRRQPLRSRLLARLKELREKPESEMNFPGETRLRVVAGRYQEQTEQALSKLRMTNVERMVFLLIGTVIGSMLTLWVKDVQQNQNQAAFERGRQARDQEAYSNLHIWSSTDWTVKRVNAPWVVVETSAGETKSLKFCEEEPYVRAHWKIKGMSAYLRGDCFSLRGPQASIAIDKSETGEPIVHEIAMRESQ